MNFLFSRTSIVKQLTEDGSKHLPAHIPEKFQAEFSGRAKLAKQTTIGDLECTILNPTVEGRIRLLNPTVSFFIFFFSFSFFFLKKSTHHGQMDLNRLFNTLLHQVDPLIYVLRHSSLIEYSVVRLRDRT